MTWIFWTVVYILVHFCTYTIVLRNRESFTRERSIFLYHLASEIVWPVLLLVGGAVGWWPAPGAPALIAVLSLHGIYSLTFLSLWSLASGGYSIAILDYVRAHGARNVHVDPEPLAQIGAQKQEGRLAAIQRIGLVYELGSLFRTTPRGSVVASALGLLAWMLGIPASG
ncbi:MAG: hypothetical protein JO023_17105 [Chloroflexi bacterium]|nr:hypothetical protein [Chloroflexota bacterium]